MLVNILLEREKHSLLLSDCTQWQKSRKGICERNLKGNQKGCLQHSLTKIKGPFKIQGHFRDILETWAVSEINCYSWDLIREYPLSIDVVTFHSS